MQQPLRELEESVDFLEQALVDGDAEQGLTEAPGQADDDDDAAQWPLSAGGSAAVSAPGDADSAAAADTVASLSGPRQGRGYGRRKKVKFTRDNSLTVSNGPCGLASQAPIDRSRERRLAGRLAHGGRPP